MFAWLVVDLLSDTNTFPGQVVIAVHAVYLHLKFFNATAVTSADTDKERSDSRDADSGTMSWKQQYHSADSNRYKSFSERTTSKTLKTVAATESTTTASSAGTTVNVPEALLLHVREVFDTVICSLLSVTLNTSNLTTEA